MTDPTVPTTSDTGERKPRAYPLDMAVTDPRFSFGLALDVGAVLVEHGYPSPLVSGLDVVALEQALSAFLYRPVSVRLGNQLDADPDHGRTTAVAEAKPDTLGVALGRASVPDMQTQPKCLPGCYDPTLIEDHVPGCPVAAIQSS